MGFPKKLVPNTAALSGGGGLGIPFQYTVPTGASGVSGALMTNGGKHSTVSYDGISTYGEKYSFSQNFSFGLQGGRGFYSPVLRSSYTEKKYIEVYCESVQNKYITWMGFSISPSYSFSYSTPYRHYAWRGQGNVYTTDASSGTYYGHQWGTGDTVSLYFNGSQLGFYKNGTFTGNVVNTTDNYNRLIVIASRDAGAFHVNLQGA